MKKFLASTVLVIFFIVSTGFTVNLHYCMDQFHSWDFGATDDESCDQCGMKTAESNSCCRDEVKVLKLPQDVFQAKVLIYQIDIPLLISYVSYYSLLPLQNAAVNSLQYCNDPPDISKEETYLDNCVFRI